MKSIVLVFLILTTTSLLAQTKVAMVKKLRGDVEVMTIGKTAKLLLNDWVEAGSVVKTGDKSFAQLVFIDKSTMNIVPNTEMKIEQFSGKDAGVIDLVKGQIKSTVTKDYLQMKQDRSKLFIKTQNAVMGVRGTEFDVITNGKSTVAVLHEGEIVFNRLDERGKLSSERLEQIVDAGVRLLPRDFSVMDSTRVMPTVPARLNPTQLEALQKADGSSDDRSPSNSKPDTSARSVVPAGLSGAIVSNNTEVLKSEVGQVIGAQDPGAAPASGAANAGSSADAEGYVKGNLVKPANGSFVHLASGTIIPPPPNAVLDSNTNTYLAGSETGSVGADGSFIPPKNVEITNDGKILVATTTATGTVVVKEVAPPSPVVSATNTTLTAMAMTGASPQPGSPMTGTTTPVPKTGDIPLPQPGLDTRFAPTGGIINVNDPTRQSTLIDTTIIVNPTGP